MKTVFYISFIGILFFGCTKAGKNISVIGRVYNPVTNEGIPNIEIKLLKEKLSLSGGNDDVKTVYTDANGYYELDHTSVGARYVGCFLDNDQYYRIGWIRDGENEGVSAVEVSKGKFTYLDYQVAPYGSFGIEINNVNCQSANDTIIIRMQNNADSFLDSDWIIKGCNGYTTAIERIPMGLIYIQWITKRSGISNSFSDQIYIGEGQEVVYTLDY